MTRLQLEHRPPCPHGKNTESGGDVTHSGQVTAGSLSWPSCMFSTADCCGLSLFDPANDTLRSCPDCLTLGSTDCSVSNLLLVYCWFSCAIDGVWEISFGEDSSPPS